MERNAFKLLHDMENSWWYRGRAAVVRGLISKEKNKGKVLDFGAGFGGMYPELAVRGEVYAFEPDKEAQRTARSRPYAAIYDSEKEALDNSYDLIGLFDVLEHLPDDKYFLNKARKSLNKNGKLAITVPANPFLWSEHDVSHHHYRRYT